MSAPIYTHEARVRLLARLYQVTPVESADRVTLELPWVTYVAPLPEESSC